MARTRQPQTPLRVSGKWLSRGMVSSFNPAAGLVDLTSNEPANIVGNISSSVDQSGRSWKGAYQQSNNYVNVPRKSKHGYVAGVTFEALVRPISYQTSNFPYISGVISQFHSNDDASVFYRGPSLRFNDNATAERAGNPTFIVAQSDTEYAATGTAIAAGELVHLIGLYNGSNVVLWVNGVKVVGAALTGNIQNDSGNFITLLSDFVVMTAALSHNRCLNGNLFFANIYNRGLSDAEALERFSDQWGHLALQRRPFIFFGPAAGGTTTAESVSSRLKARGSETSAPTRAEAATARRKARGAATTTAIKAEAVVGRRKARGAATTTTALRTESGVGRVKARGTTTVTHIDAGAVVESVAGRRQVRASATTTPIRTEAIVARRKARGSDTVTLTRTEAAVARRRARGVANAAPLIAGMITESIAAGLRARASSTATTTRIEAVTARRQARGTAVINSIREMLAAGRRRLRGAATAAPYVAPTLPVEVPESTRTIAAQEVRIGATPTRKAPPRLG